MTMRRYHPPITFIDGISTKYPYLQEVNPIGETSMQLTNEHRWEDETLNEGLDNSQYANTAPKLWDE